MLNDENNTVDSMSVENFNNNIQNFYRKYGEQSVSSRVIPMIVLVICTFPHYA